MTGVSERYVCNLHELSPDAIESYGGKATNLSILQRSGFRTPKGFAISGHYYRDMLETIPVAQKLLNRLDSVDDFEEIIELAVNLQAALASSGIPSDMLQEVRRAFSDLQGGNYSESGYAVRSSASIEDTGAFSFAGQAESYLCVKKLDDILTSIKKVWQSAISPQSAIYLKTRGIRMDTVRMGVVVQEMVDADISGVLFTVNVIENNKDQMLIESTWGLGEGIVGGKVVPDTFIVDRTTISPLNKILGSKELTFIQGDGCTVRYETPLVKRGAFTLSDSDLERLVGLALKVEERMGCPQDIEWCMKNGEIVILQSRPITTLS